MPASADVLATDELEGCEIGEIQVRRHLGRDTCSHCSAVLLRMGSDWP